MFHSINVVLKENYDNRYRLFRLANYELKAQSSGTLFGVLWNILNPILQIFVYWFVLAIGLNVKAPIGKYPYIIWMIVGIIPWFYISNALLASTTSIYAFSGVVKRMRFPLSIVPVKTVLSALIGHIWAMIVVFAVILMSGYPISIYSYQLVYYIFCSFVFLVGFALFSSAITVLFKDFQKIMFSVIRLFFYVTPVLWSYENLPEKIVFFLKLNPFVYIIEGYRESVLYGRSLGEHWKQGLYFWFITSIFFMVGCSVHLKFRRKFIDLI